MLWTDLREEEFYEAIEETKGFAMPVGVLRCTDNTCR